MVAITTKEAKEKILAFIIGGQIATAEWTYAPDRAVITISNFVRQIEGLTKYRARLALRELIAEGLICYTSQGNPAVVSYGEVPELVYDAAPPTNGYALTEKGYKSDKYKTAYGAWCKSLEEWRTAITTRRMIRGWNRFSEIWKEYQVYEGGQRFVAERAFESFRRKLPDNQKAGAWSGHAYIRFGLQNFPCA